MESFLKVSLLLADQELIKVQHHGCKMLQVLPNTLLHHSASCSYSEMIGTLNSFISFALVIFLQHLLKYRSEKLSSADLLKLMLQLVKSDHDLVLESAEAISEETVNTKDGSILGKSDGSSPEKSDGSTDSRSSMSDKRPQNSDWSAAPTVYHYD